MIYVIVGPTCSHKTTAACLLSDKLCAPIINGDAFQIYQDMNIGTSKITQSDKYYARHHLLDIVKPNETYSVMRYQLDGRRCLDELLNKENKDVIIVGGTGLYIKALLFDYEFKDEEPADNSELEKLDNRELHQILEKLDPVEATKIHENNRKRVMRAINLIRANNIKKSELISSQTHSLIYPKEEVKIMFISPEREKLYDDINRRVIEMMNSGLVEEVKELLDKYELSMTAKAAIGYKEVIDYLENKLNYEECVALIQKRTRNYAKRQITFFKHQFGDVETYSSYQELLSRFDK